MPSEAASTRTPDGSERFWLLLTRFGSGPAAAARLLVVIMLGVVASFLAATALSQYAQGAIDLRVGDIVGNAMPSVHYLSQARSDLRRLDGELVNLLIAQRATPNDLAVAEHYLMMMKAPLESYRALPFFPGERALYEQLVAAALAELDATLERARGDRDGATLLASISDAHRAALTVDEGIQRMVEFDATQGQRLGLSIAVVRQRSLDVLWLVELLTVALAAVATVAAFRNLRRTLELLASSRQSAEQRASMSEERAHELDQFAGRVAHDLRSPLAAISMRLSMAERKATPEVPPPPLVAQIRQNVQRMDGLIDGLLDFARAGARPQPDQRADAAAVLKEVVTAIRAEAGSLGVTLELEVVGDGTVSCGSGLVTSVVSNLLRNALKYIHDGRATERRITARLHQQTGCVRVEIEDTGPGIPKEAQARVFEPFVRLNTQQPGIGLGLATVKRIVEAHQGRVGVSSVPGEGSCFWFELPQPHAPRLTHASLSPKAGT
jgi:signal transduction histidine kinase